MLLAAACRRWSPGCTHPLTWLALCSRSLLDEGHPAGGAEGGAMLVVTRPARQAAAAGKQRIKRFNCCSCPYPKPFSWSWQAAAAAKQRAEEEVRRRRRGTPRLSCGEGGGEGGRGRRRLSCGEGGERGGEEPQL